MDNARSAADVSTLMEQVLYEVKRVVVGQDRFLERVLVAMLAQGHLLVRAARNFQTIDMFVPLITVSLLGLLLNAGFDALCRQLLRGFPEEIG